MSDLRSYPRVRINRPVQVRLSSGSRVQARMVNICQGGMAILYEAPAEIGATLRLSFSLPIRGRAIDFNVESVARYNYLSSQGYIIGFEFKDLDAGQGEHIREFVAIKRSMKDV